MQKRLVLLALVIGACGAPKERAVAAEETVTIRSNTQATLGAVSVGAGNIWKEGYTPEGGSPKTGLTAGLWLSVRDDAAQSQHLRVHPGQKVRAAGLALRVVDVTADAVTLAIVRPAR